MGRVLHHARISQKHLPSIHQNQISVGYIPSQQAKFFSIQLLDHLISARYPSPSMLNQMDGLTNS